MAEPVKRFDVVEIELRTSDQYDNPYTDVSASAVLTGPDGDTRKQPLFWDGDDLWKFRFSPTVVGKWSWEISSDEGGLNGQSGEAEVQKSQTAGGICRMDDNPLHFARQDGSPFWFAGDTAWALLTDDELEKHDRQAAFAYIDRRISQGFNVFHTMCISEAGWGNAGGEAFRNLSSEQINPSYWQEVDERIRYVNSKGATVGLVLAWADKGRNPNSWRAFPSQEARERYAKCITARYSAFDVYFIVAGEWNADTRRELDLTDDEIRDQYRAIGRTVMRNDPHDRLIGIHPTIVGTSREFSSDDWCATISKCIRTFTVRS